MSASIGGKIDRNWTNLRRANVRDQAKGKPLVDEDIIEFCEKRLHIKPTSYQKKLLEDPTSSSSPDGPASPVRVSPSQSYYFTTL